MAESPPVPSLLDLSGRNVLVTGASGNLGQGIALRLKEAGASVVVHYHSDVASARWLAHQLGDAPIAGADLSDESAVAGLFDKHRIDDVVNNAATQPVAALDDMTLEDWRAIHASNLDSVFLVTRNAATRWKTTGHAGAIVNIASIEAMDPAVGHAHYATTKAGLVMFTRAAALEFGGDGIRINAVSPGLIDRDGLEDDWPDGVERWRDRAPLGRLGTPNDVADAVLFLLSPAARWISGVNLVVDGGMSSQNKY
ncbi:MAG: SDR family NAD(P)-dependent oxidoreductase [Woeseiaceae bacterium]|nr:SDR family NAD(P)-dependent oxidoreductase [Woeseiaceae bacterium]